MPLHFDQTTFGLQGFTMLWQTPGLINMAMLSIGTGLISTLLAFIITLMILAAFFNSPWLNRIQRLLSPIFSDPTRCSGYCGRFFNCPFRHDFANYIALVKRVGTCTKRPISA